MPPLTILNVAFPLATVGPDAVGGAEQVLAAIDAALVEAGHESIVIASAGSTVRGALLPTPAPPALLDERAYHAAHAAHRAAIARALSEREVDLVHLHGVDFHCYLPPAGWPALVTLHLPLSWYPARALRPERAATYLHGVSAAQHRSGPPGIVLLDPIPNGVPTDVLHPEAPRGEYALALGRICPEKGFHLAIDAARAADVSLVLAGQVFGFPEHERYFEREVRPRLDRRRRFIGPVGLAKKRRLLAHARCLLVTSLTPEAASLASMEALACGTPVVAFALGALPDMIEHGVTGFLVAPGDLDAAARAIEDCRRLRPADCRAAAERRFSVARMTGDYLRRYRELVDLHERVSALATATRPASPTISAEVISEPNHLERLQGEWQALWQACPHARVFQRPEWLLPWCRHLGPTAARVLAVRRDGALVGLVPLTYYRRGQERVFGLLGGGVSDVLDALIDPAHEDAVGAALLQHLGRALEPWDALDLERLPRGSPLLRLDLPRTHEELLVQDVCPVVALPLTPGDLGDVVSRRLLKDLDAAWRRLGRRGRVEAARVTQAEVPEALEALFRLHGARWSRRGAAGALAAPAVQRFHRDAAAALARSGLLRMHALRLDGQLVAVVHALRDRRRVAYYLGGFDPALEAFAPGALVLRAAVEDAIRTGATEFDFLSGREPYKYRWGGRDEPLRRRVLRRGTSRDQSAA